MGSISKEQEVKYMVEDLVLQCGVSPDTYGYDYLITAVILLVEAPSRYKGRITKMLYPNIAEIYGSTTPRVERCIRHAIQSVFSKYPDHVKEVLGLAWKECYMQENKCPTNSEFMYMLVYIMKRKLSSKDAT